MDRYGRQKPLGLKGQQGGGNSPLEHAGDDCQAACEYMFFNSQAMCPGGCTPYPQGGTGCSCMHTCTLYNNLIPHLCEVYEYCCQNTNWEDFAIFSSTYSSTPFSKSASITSLPMS